MSDQRTDDLDDDELWKIASEEANKLVHDGIVDFNALLLAIGTRLPGGRHSGVPLRLILDAKEEAEAETRLH
jgi:hypothetical protein